MSDKIKGFVVCLDEDVSEEFGQRLREAIVMMKGVASVSTEIVGANDYMARARVDMQWRNRLIEFIMPGKSKRKL